MTNYEDLEAKIEQKILTLSAKEKELKDLKDEYKKVTNDNNNLNNLEEKNKK